MTTINTLDDFLKALDDNPTWREAVRARILGEDVLQLPAKFDAFVDEQRAFNEGTRAAIAELRAATEEVRAATVELRAFNEEQRVWNQNATARFDRMEGDMGSIKGFYANYKAVQAAPWIASDMGLEHIHTLSMDDLGRMAARNLPLNVARSFREADLVMEVTDGNETSYVAMEISFTADKRDSDRAIRNANLLTQLTGKPARAAIASVRNDYEVTELVESGALYWHPLEDRLPRPELPQ